MTSKRSLSPSASAVSRSTAAGRRKIPEEAVGSDSAAVAGRGWGRAGVRASGRAGRQEFADFRDYEPGDDLRDLDWSAYARLEKLFIK